MRFIKIRRWLWRTRLRVRIVRWRIRLKFAITTFKLKRWRAFRLGIPISYHTRGKRPGSIVVMHCRNRKYDYSIYRVINWGGTLRKVYP